MTPCLTRKGNIRVSTITIKLTESRAKRIGVAAAAVIMLVFYVYSQLTLYSSSEGETIVYSFFVPCFIAFVLASILFDISVEPEWAKLVAKIFAIALCILAVLCASEILIDRFLWQLLTRNPDALFFGFVLLSVIAFFFYGITGSVPWGLRIMVILVMVYCYVNYFVTMFRGTPLVPVDILTVGTAMDVVGSYTFAWTDALSESLLVFAGVFVVAPRLKMPNPEGGKKIVARVLGIIIPLVFVGLTVQRHFIYSMGFQASTWEQTRTQRSHGNVLNFYSNICESYVWAPEGYSVNAVNEIAERYTSDSVSDATEKPDVILILGESWADLVPEGYATATGDPLTFTRSLAGQSNSDVRTLVTSTYGAGTSRSEFEILTGAAQAYGMSQAPFQFSVSEPLPNIVQSFKDLGYDTTAMHTGLKESWDRDTAFPLLGFDAYYDQFDMQVNESDYLRGWIQDSVLYDEALAHLDQSDGPQFMYLISIATHGGYRNEAYQSPIEIESPAGDYPLTEQYLGVLQESDQDLQAFIQELSQREKPTIVLFFGDHLPYVDDEYNNDVLKAYDDWMWAHTTYYGVWANYDLPETVYDDVSSLSLNYLGPYLMEAAGLPLTGYQKYLRDCTQEYSAVSTSAFITPEGERISADEGKETELGHEQAILQYGLVFDTSKMPRDFFYLKE